MIGASVVCWIIGHDWRQVPFTGNRSVYLISWHRCDRCGATR